MTSGLPAEAVDVERLGAFSFRWPDAEEHFESGWAYRLKVGGETHAVRHGLGGRVVYGRCRVHTGTWLDGEVQVEGVEADDYPTTGALLSGIRRPDRSLVRTPAEVPAGYGGFDLVEHRREIDAKWSRNCIAVKIRQDDLGAWASMPCYAANCAEEVGLPRRPPHRQHRSGCLLRHQPIGWRSQPRSSPTEGRSRRRSAGGRPASRRTTMPTLFYADPWAFLVAVICDQGILAERAWAIPYELLRRLA
jgi:hypothetical protein